VKTNKNFIGTFCDNIAASGKIGQEVRFCSNIAYFLKSQVLEDYIEKIL